MPFQTHADRDSFGYYMDNPSLEGDLFGTFSMGELPGLGVNRNMYDSLLPEYLVPPFSHQVNTSDQSMRNFSISGGKHVAAVQDQGSAFQNYDLASFPSSQASQYTAYGTESIEFVLHLVVQEPSLRLAYVFSFDLLPLQSLGSVSDSTLSPSELVQKRHDEGDDTGRFLSDDLDVPMEPENPLMPAISPPLANAVDRTDGPFIMPCPEGYRRVQDHTTPKWRRILDLSDDYFFYYYRDPPATLHPCSISKCKDVVLANGIKDHIKEKHRRIASQPGVTCKECTGRRSMNARSYEDHFLEVHSGRSIRCPYCLIKQCRPKNFYRHLQTCPGVAKYQKEKPV